MEIKYTIITFLVYKSAWKNKDWGIVKGRGIIIVIKVLFDTSINNLRTWALDLE